MGFIPFMYMIWITDVILAHTRYRGNALLFDPGVNFHAMKIRNKSTRRIAPYSGEILSQSGK
jgi:hypothetical protein